MTVPRSAGAKGSPLAAGAERPPRTAKTLAYSLVNRALDDAGRAVHLCRVLAAGRQKCRNRARLIPERQTHVCNHFLGLPEVRGFGRIAEQVQLHAAVKIP